MASDDDQRFIIGLRRGAGEARSRPCRLIVGDDGEAILEAEGETLTVAPFSLLAISDRVGSIPRHVRFPDGSDFETVDNDEIDALQRRFRGAGAGAIHELERFRPRLLLFVALTMVLCAALYRYAVPALVEVAVWATPPAVTQLMSRSVLASLDGAVFEPSGLSAERQAAFRSGFRKLLDTRIATARATVPLENYSLNFRKGGQIGPNAFALPDGTVVVTDELIEFANDDEMVMGVLAHEIGHVVHEHSLRQLYRAAGVTGLIMLIGGDIGAATEDILVQGAALLSLSHSRDAEREADRHSVELMHAAGQDPAAVARFFELLRDRFGDTGSRDFLSTHPATPERIAETRRYAEEIAAGAK